MATHALPSSHLTASHITSSHTADNTGVALTPSRPSLLRRLYIAILVSQMRRAQSEIDRKLGPGAWDRVKHTEPPER
jgi:hypothetical protein